MSLPSTPGVVPKVSSSSAGGGSATNAHGLSKELLFERQRSPKLFANTPESPISIHSSPSTGTALKSFDSGINEYQPAPLQQSTHELSHTDHVFVPQAPAAVLPHPQQYNPENLSTRVQTGNEGMMSSEGFAHNTTGVNSSNYWSMGATGAHGPLPNLGMPENYDVFPSGGSVNAPINAGIETWPFQGREVSQEEVEYLKAKDRLLLAHLNRQEQNLLIMKEQSILYKQYYERKLKQLQQTANQRIECLGEHMRRLEEQVRFMWNVNLQLGTQTFPSGI